MKFYSINRKSSPASFKQALLSGLAPDGGLYYPEVVPKFSEQEIENFKNKSLAEIGFEVLNKWAGDEINSNELKEIATQALNFSVPLKKLGNFFVLELFHGPTMAFKDIAARVLALLMSNVLKEQNQRATILVATSGDTGGAVAHGFDSVPNINVVVLYPKGKISRLQEEQLTRVASNIFSIEVEGVFDDCQALVKKALVDENFKKIRLSSANSISVGRLIPQIIYYIYAYSQIPEKNLEFVVPCGNFGNVCGGLFGREMGLPFNQFLVANNINDPVLKYYNTGVFKPQTTISTLSTAMDIGHPSNFIRVLEIFQHNYEAFKKTVKVTKITDEETIKTIKRVYKEYNYILDPHTAVAWAAAEEAGNAGYLKIILSTASPVKFADVIQRRAGIEISDEEAMKTLEKKTKRKTAIINDYDVFKKVLITLPL